MNTTHTKHPRENVYTCQKCGFMLLTVDVDHGVTPFMLLCMSGTGCGAPMFSSMYPRGPKPDSYPKEASHEWYKPSSAQHCSSSLEDREHVRRGGLLLRKRTDATPIYHGEEPPDDGGQSTTEELRPKPRRPLPLHHIPGKFGRTKRY